MKLFKLLFLIVISLNINVLMAEVDIGNEQNNSPESISAAPTSGEIKSGVNALATLTGDSRVTAVGNGVAGYMLFQSGMSKGGFFGGGTPELILAGLEFAQLPMNLLTSNSARNAAGEVGNFGLENGGFSDGASLGNGDGGFGPNTNLDNAFTDFSSDPAVVEAFGNIPNFAAAANSLSEKGFSVEPETGAVTLPNGKTLSPKEVQKAVGRALKDPKLQAFQKTLAKKRKKYLNRISRFRAGGGGGYKSTSARRGDKANAKRPGYNFNFGNKKGSRSIASVPGKVKMVNGDPLGAASDNVFHIVERAYQGLVTSKVLQEKVPKLGK